MAAFVRVSAVLVGTVNALVILAIGLWLAEAGAEELEGLNWYQVLLGLSIATAAGLTAAELVLRIARQALLGSFLSRYAAVALGACLGGALTVLVPALLIGVPVGIAEPSGNVLFVVTFTVYGGLAGLIEGLILAFPLAWLLGMFRSPAAVAQASSRA